MRAALAGVFVALGAFAQLVGIEWLRNASATMAIIFAAATVWTVKGRTDLERGAEQTSRRRYTRTEIKGIEGIDPTDVGVEAAASQEILSGGAIPEYLPREIDGAFDQAIESALDGSGPWIVVAIGRSKVGKSRALFEALRRFPLNELEFIAPVDAKALEALLIPEERLDLEDCPAVLWLDDLEPFLSKGVNLQILQEWHRLYPKSVVAGIYGGKGSDDLSEADASALTTIAGDILQHSVEIIMQATTAAEIEPLVGVVSSADKQLLEKHGLAAFLVAAPELERKLTLMRGRNGATCPEGAALARAAAEWARCGRTDPISETLLREIWVDHLEASMLPSDESFALGLKWALQPVAGSVALLERAADGFRPHDYVVRIVASQSTHPPLERVWTAAAKDATDSEALAVATVAYVHGNFAVAEDLFRIASSSSAALVAAIGGFNLAVTLGGLGRQKDALEAYDTVIERFLSADAVAVREQAARAMLNKAVILGRLDRRDEELEANDQVVARFADTGEVALDLQVAIALANKGVALGQNCRFNEELEAFEEILGRFNNTEDSKLRVQVALGLVGKGIALSALNRDKEALAVHDEVLDRFGDTTSPELLNQVARAEAARLVILGHLGLDDLRQEAYEYFIKRFGNSSDPEVQEHVARAMVARGIALGEADHPIDARKIFRSVTERFGSASSEVVLEQAAIAAGNEGVALIKLGDPGEALLAYEAAAEHFGGRFEEVIRDQVALMLLGKANALGELGQVERQIMAYRELISRFGDSDRLIQQEKVAEAMNGLAVLLGRLEKTDEAIVVLEKLVKQFGNETAAEIREQVGLGYGNIGTAYREQQNNEKALEGFETAIGYLGVSEDQKAKENFVVVLLNRAFTLDEMGCHERALEGFADVLARVDEGDIPGFRELGVRATVGRANALGSLGKRESQLELLEEVACLPDDSLPQIRLPIATALAQKGALLGGLDRHGEALVVFQEIISRFGDDEEMPMQLEVANAMGNLCVALMKLERDREVPAVSREIVTRYGDIDDVRLRSEVAAALLRSALVHQRLGQPEEALVVVEELMTRFAAEQFENQIAERVAQAMELRVASLYSLGREKESRAALEELIKCFGRATDPVLRQRVAVALSKEVETATEHEQEARLLHAYERTAELFVEDEELPLRLAGVRALGAKGALWADTHRVKEALLIFDDVIDHCGKEVEAPFREQCAVALINKALALRKEERKEEASTTYEEVISRYGDAEEPELQELVKLVRTVLDGNADHPPSSPDV